ncbi:hypothetical protein ACWF7H_17755 [Peribacillus butanolivorans]|uniref:hypothetical protein n=1 Tax=Peribacillus butanolivorans TaxID=421767 RepID=UPI0036AE5EF9
MDFKMYLGGDSLTLTRTAVFDTEMGRKTDESMNFKKSDDFFLLTVTKSKFRLTKMLFAQKVFCPLTD